MAVTSIICPCVFLPVEEVQGTGICQGEGCHDYVGHCHLHPLQQRKVTGIYYLLSLHLSIEGYDIKRLGNRFKMMNTVLFHPVTSSFVELIATRCHRGLALNPV